MCHEAGKQRLMLMMRYIISCQRLHFPKHTNPSLTSIVRDYQCSVYNHQWRLGHWTPWVTCWGVTCWQGTWMALNGCREHAQLHWDSAPWGLERSHHRWPLWGHGIQFSVWPTNICRTFHQVSWEFGVSLAKRHKKQCCDVIKFNCAHCSHHWQSFIV